MPNRIIRESCRTSPNLNSVSAEAERLFWRQVTVADDYGCFDADPRVMLAQCFPLLIGTVTVEQVRAWRDECVRADLMRLYESKGRTYGMFPTWFEHQREARSKRKFPAPPRRVPDASPQDVVVPQATDHNAPQPAADCSDPRLGIVNREVVNREVVNRESRIVNREVVRRETSSGPPAAEPPVALSPDVTQPARLNGEPQEAGIPEPIRQHMLTILARARSPGRRGKQPVRPDGEQRRTEDRA